MKTENREKAIYKVTWVGFFVNLALSIGKLLAGIFGRSGAMVADAVHSISDFATTDRESTLTSTRRNYLENLFQYTKKDTQLRVLLF